MFTQDCPQCRFILPNDASRCTQCGHDLSAPAGFTKACPKCEFIVPSDAKECTRCGVIFDKIRSRPRPSQASEGPGPTESSTLAAMLRSQTIYVDQFPLHWWEILLNLEQRNEYQICEEQGRLVGTIAEQGTGLVNALIRIFAGSHRPLDVTVFSATAEIVLQFKRAWFWFFSSLSVLDAFGQSVGQVERRFAITHKRYDLFDSSGRKFAYIQTPLWSLWTFPVLLPSGQKVGFIRKRWSGLLQEMFTDADRFQIDFGTHPWTPNQRAVFFAAAISIDFDFFENNNG